MGRRLRGQSVLLAQKTGHKKYAFGAHHLGITKHANVYGASLLRAGRQWQNDCAHTRIYCRAQVLEQK
jgi:hypothetical protein